MTLCVLLYLRIVMKINHLCLESMNQCCLFLYSLLCYYVLYFIMLYGRFLICYYVMFLSSVVWALSDLLLCHVFVLCCMGAFWFVTMSCFCPALYRASDLACVGHGHLCFVFSCHHCFHFYSCCGTRKLYGKDGEYFSFYMGLCLILWNVVENCLTWLLVFY